MVNLNLTFFVELALFLIFLWGANRLAFRPMLRVMDDRADTVAKNREAAAQGHAEAQDLEARYTRNLLDAKRAASEAFRQARRAALEKENAILAERRRESEEQVAQTRQVLQNAVETERQHYAALVPDIVSAIDAWALGGKRS